MEDQLASLIHALFVISLVRKFEGQVCYQRRNCAILMLGTVIACVMFLWDYILTFGMEVDLVWKSKWNFTKGLYLFQRYFPFTEFIWLVLYSPMGEILGETGRRRVCYADGVFKVIGFAASEMILTLRTWAVWNRNLHLSIILPILYSLCWGSSLIIMVIIMNSNTFSEPPYPGYWGCSSLYGGSQNLIVLWALLIIWDAVLFILMLVPAIRAYRDGCNSSLMTMVYHDGVVYYLYLFVLSFINIVIVKALPQDYQLLLALVERMFHAMLASRVVLHIRAQAGNRPVWTDGLTELHTIHFHDSDAVS